MRTPSIAALLVSAILMASAANAQDSERAPRVSERPVVGTTLRVVEAVTVVRAPFASVAREVLDYARYPDFMRRFRSARVVRRERAHTDVYFQLELPRAMGVVWFLHRMTVIRRGADALEIRGEALSGNLGSVETRVIVERGTAADATRLSFSLFGAPVLPVLPATVNSTLREAVVGAVTLLKQHIETQVAVHHP